MIYTCTINPSLDYFVNINHQLEPGKINRTSCENFSAGGKGVNVSIVLNNLKINSTALGFLGGFVRDYYLNLLQDYRYILPNFTPISHNTRINIKLNDDVNETDINASGPIVSSQEYCDFLNRTERIYPNDTFVLSGHVQQAMYQRMLDLVENLNNRDVKIILDTNPELMSDCLKYHPLLVKPNLSELIQMADCLKEDANPERIQDVIKCASKVNQMGAQNVIVSLGKTGALLVNQNGVYQSEPIIGEVVSTTGCGDSMIGAYVFNLQRGANALEAFAYACAAGSATAFKNGLANRDEIEAIYSQVKIVKL